MRNFRWLLLWPVMMAFSADAAIMGEDSRDAAKTVFDLGLSGNRGCFGFSNANDMLAVADYRNGMVQLYDLRELKLRGKLTGFPQEQGLTGFVAVRFSSDDTQLAVLLAGPQLRILDLRDQKVVHEFSPHCKGFWSAAISPDLSMLALGERGTLSLWDIKLNTRSHAIDEVFSYVWSLTFSHSGKYLASTSSFPRGWPKIWSVKAGSQVMQLDGVGTYLHTYYEYGQQKSAELLKSGVHWSSVAFSVDDTMLAAVGPRFDRQANGPATRYDVATIWSVATGKKIWELELPNRVFRAIAVVPARNCVMLAGGIENKSVGQSDAYCVKVFALDSPRELYNLRGHTDTVQSIQVSHDGRWMATGSDDATVRLWDLTENRELSPQAEPPSQHREGL